LQFTEAGPLYDAVYDVVWPRLQRFGGDSTSPPILYRRQEISRVQLATHLKRRAIMKYLLVLAAVLALAACEKSGDTNNAPAESSGEATSEAMNETAPAVMDESDAMAETMDSTMDGAEAVVGEIEEAATESDESAEIEMEQTEESLDE
jgi:predicted small lipoprotein YifL